jgi:hypothetical protein
MSNTREGTSWDIAPIRPSCQIDLDSDAKKSLESVAELQGMTQIAVVSAMVEWFISLSPEEQRLVLTKGEGELAARTWLKRLARRKTST